MSEIARTIDYVKGRIKSLENAHKPLPFQKFDQKRVDKNIKKLHHYRLILQALREKQECGAAPKVLTLAELKRKSGELVYVMFKDIAMKAFVAYHDGDDEFDGDFVWLTNNLGGRNTYEDVIEMGGIIYNRPPREDNT